MVGISGANGERLSPVVASATRRPAFICGSATGVVAIINCVSLASNEVNAGPAPRYGMCVISIPAAYRSISIDRCDTPPLPDDGKLSLPGRDLAICTSSATVLAPTCGFTTRTFGAVAASTTGTKSATGSNGSLRYMLGLIEWLIDTKPSVYPSGTECARISVPTIDAAPGRLSTMTDCPHC